MLEITDAINKMDLPDIYRIFHPNSNYIPACQHLMEHSQKLTTYSDTKQVSTDTEKKQNKTMHPILPPWIKTRYLFCLFGLFWFFKSGFLCVAVLAVLELTL